MSAVRTAALAALVAASALAAGLAHAQVYRIVGPDGKVTFSDRPPPDARSAPQAVSPGAGNATPASSLPPALRRVAGQYPVALYTTANCAPCDAGRNYLRQRGVPHVEHTVSTREDFAALQRLSGAGNLPFLTIGAQHVPGFSEVEWSQYFDAAGYPRTSQLPASYRHGEPRPLVAVQARPVAPTAAAPAARPQTEAASKADLPNPDNPAGIRF